MQISLSKIMLSTVAMALVFSGWRAGGVIPTLCLAAFVIAITLRWGYLAVICLFASFTAIATLPPEGRGVGVLWITCVSFLLSMFFAFVNDREIRSAKERARTDSKTECETLLQDRCPISDNSGSDEPWNS